MNESLPLEDLYTQYRPMILNFFISKSLPYDVAEDLTQDLFLNILKSTGSFEGRCKVSSYLYLCAKNLYYEFLRNKRNQFNKSCSVPLDKASHVCTSNNIEDTLVSKEEIKKVKFLVSQLKEEDQELIEARLDKYPFQWISIRTGVSETTLKTRLHRTRKKLKRDFDLLMGSEA